VNTTSTEVKQSHKHSNNIGNSQPIIELREKDKAGVYFNWFWKNKSS